MSSSLLPRVISSSVAIANHAGGIIREIMSHGELEIVTKEHARDLQTKADRTCQSIIVGSLLKHFPRLKVIGEEQEVEPGKENLLSIEKVENLDLTCPDQFNDIKEEDIVVWVDPLDGTAEYTQGLLDHVTVLIGIATGGKIIGGIVHQPYFNYQNPGAALGRTIYALKGNKVGGMEVLPPPKEGCIVATTRSHSSSTVNDAVTAVGPSEVMRVGGAGHKVLLLLDGIAHMYVFASPGCKKWDTAAPQSILEAAGGVLTDIKGDPIPYDADAPHRNSTGVLATAPGIDHQNAVAKIPQQVKNNLKA